MMHIVKPHGAMIALAIVLIFLLSLPYPASSSSIYGWRDFIVLAEDAIVKVSVGISAKGNVWDLTYPLEVYVEASMLKEEFSKPTYVFLKITYSIGDENVGSDEIYVGSISSLSSLLKITLPIYPKGEIIEKASSNVDSVEITPTVVVIRNGKVFESPPAAPFTIPIVPPITETEVSSSTYLTVGTNATVYFKISTRYPWNIASEAPTVNIEVYGENIKDSISMVTIVQVNNRMVASQFLGSFTSTFRKSFQIFLPPDTLKDICLEGEVRVNVEFLILKGNGETLSKNLGLKVKCVNPENAIKVYVTYPSTVFSGEEFALNIVLKNALAGVTVKLSAIEVYVDNKLARAENVGNIEIPPLSKYEYALRLTISSLGEHSLTVKVHYKVGLFYGEANKGPLKITVLNPVSLQAVTNMTQPGKTIVLKAYIGLPRIKAKLQTYVNETEEWKTIREVELVFPETEIKVKAPYSEGKYIYRLLLENNVASNSVEILVKEEVEKKSVEEKVSTEKTFSVKVVAKPSVINTVPNDKISIQASVSEKNLSLELVKYDSTVGDWILIPNANITKKTETLFTIVFNAPAKPGTYKYKLVALKGKEKVGESNVVIVNVSSVEKKVASQPIIPFEMFTAVLSTMGALSFIIWRRYRT